MEAIAVEEQPGPRASRPGAVLAIWYLTLGVVAATAGATIAIPHLRVEGVTPEVVVAAAALVAGVAIAFVGGRSIVGLLRGWRRLFAVPVAAAVAWCLVVPMTIAVYATNPPHPTLGEATPADRGLVYREITLTARDGVELAAWYLPSRNGAAVVLLHGASSTRTSVLAHAEVLAAAGYGVLAYDARGHGGSGGDAMELGWTAEDDVSIAVDYLESRGEIDPGRIGAVGLSLGGEVAIGAMAADPRVGVVVAEGATGRTRSDRAWLSDAYGWRGRLQYAVDAITYGLVALRSSSAPPQDLRSAARAAAPRPILLIAAGNVSSEPIAGRWIRSGSPSTVELWVVEGAGHTGGLHAAAKEWAKRVLGALEQLSEPGPPDVPAR